MGPFEYLSHFASFILQHGDVFPLAVQTGLKYICNCQVTVIKVDCHLTVSEIEGYDFGHFAVQFINEFRAQVDPGCLLHRSGVWGGGG